MSGAEERFARKLASNDLPVRNRAMKRLNRWIEERSALKDGKNLRKCVGHAPLITHVAS